MFNWRIAMPITSHLLERAYQLINANQIQNAELVLDAVVRVDPQNIEAWVAYMQIHQDHSDLEWLKDRIMRTRELSVEDKTELLRYHDALVQQLTRVEAGLGETNTSYVFNFKPGYEPLPRNDADLFELIDIFDYPAIKSEPVVKKRSSRRRWYGINLSTPTSQAVVLLITFCAAIRLLVSGFFFGYILLALFLTGCYYWFSNHKIQAPIIPMDPARMYSLDTKKELAITDKVDRASKRRSKTRKVSEPLPKS
jgi:hypothetical protein